LGGGKKEETLNRESEKKIGLTKGVFSGELGDGILGKLPGRPPNPCQWKLNEKAEKNRRVEKRMLGG